MDVLSKRHSHVTDAEFEGEINGINLTFKLTTRWAGKIYPGSLQVMKNGLILKRGADYVFDPFFKTITFMPDRPPEISSNIIINYLATH